MEGVDKFGFGHIGGISKMNCSRDKLKVQYDVEYESNCENCDSMIIDLINQQT